MSTYGSAADSLFAQLNSTLYPAQTSSNNFTQTTSTPVVPGVPAYTSQVPLDQGMYPAGSFGSPSGTFGFGSAFGQAYRSTPDNHWLYGANQRGQQMQGNFGNMTQPIAPQTYSGLLGWGLK